MQLKATEEFKNWLANLRDRQGRLRIISRLLRLRLGNPGQTRSVGNGIVELKIDFGPGYRVYCVQRGDVFVLLLCGGDKSTQPRDIERAKVLASQPMVLEDDDDPEDLKF